MDMDMDMEGFFMGEGEGEITQISEQPNSTPCRTLGYFRTLGHTWVEKKKNCEK